MKQDYGGQMKGAKRMTRLSGSIRRELPVIVGKRPLVIEVYGRHINLRRKGLRETFVIDFESIFDLARKRDFERKQKGAA